jgi:hypothetical protein
MQFRHSRLSFALALAATLPVACATSGADNEHGPVYAGDAGQDGSTMPEGSQSSPDSSSPAAETGVDSGTAAGDAAEELTALDAPDQGEGAAEDAPVEAASDAGQPDAAETGTTCTSTMALLAASSTSLAEAIYGHGQWSSATTVGSGASAAPVVVPFGTGYLASFVGTGAANDMPLESLAYTGSWTAPAAIGAALGQGTPALASLGTTGHVVYWGSNSKFYHGTYSGSAWDAANDPVEASGSAQSFGPSAPAAAATGTTLVVVQSGQDGVLYDQVWSAGSWGAATGHAGSSVISSLSPTIAAMNGGTAELMVVFVHAGDAGSYYLQYTTRAAGVWSTPADVYDQSGAVAYSSTTPALAALPGGKAILAWQGASPAYPYVSTYTPGSGWTSPVPASSDTLAAPPALAPGVCGADAVLAYVKTGGSVAVVTTSGGTWGTPQAIGGATGMQSVAVASSQ